MANNKPNVVDVSNETFKISNAPFGETVLTAICSGIRKVFNALVAIKEKEAK